MTHDNTTSPTEDDAARPAMMRRREPEKPAAAVPLRHHIDRRAGDVIAEGADGDPDELMSTSDVSEWIGLSSQWLEIGRSRGWGPPFVRLSPRRIRYLRSSVLDWLRERQFARTADYLK